MGGHGRGGARLPGGGGGGGGAWRRGGSSTIRETVLGGLTTGTAEEEGRAGSREGVMGLGCSHDLALKSHGCGGQT